MGGESIRKKRTEAEPPAPAPRTRRAAVQRQIAQAAGTENYGVRDPVHHLTESFCHTFDLLGQARAAGGTPDESGMLSAFMRDLVPGLVPEGGEKKESGPAGEQSAPGDLFTGELLERTSMDPLYRTREMEPGNRLLNRFGQVAFNRGTLAAAVLQGQGKMMLFSCLKRTVGQNKPNNIRERKLFQQSSSHRLVPKGRGALSVVNEGFTDSAVGLVVDVLKNARETVDSFTALAEGQGQNDSAGAGTLQKMYPFLTDRKERELLAGYKDRLAALGDGPGGAEEKDVLLRAIRQTEAVREKKDEMKRDFIQRLRQISHSAESAAEIFGRPAFREELLSHLQDWEAGAEPPPRDGENGESSDNTQKETTEKSARRARQRGGERGEEAAK